MGDYVTSANIKKSFDEYYEIVKEFADLCEGKLNAVNGASNSQFPNSFSAPLGANVKKIFPHTTEIMAGCSDLFDFGKPQIIRTNQRVWTSDYFALRCRIKRTYNTYEMNLSKSDSNGNRIQGSSESLYSHNMRLNFYDTHWGLKNWPQHRVDIENDILEYLPKEPAKQLEAALEKASTHRDKWIKQIKVVMGEMMELTRETVPITEPAERYAALEIDS